MKRILPIAVLILLVIIPLLIILDAKFQKYVEGRKVSYPSSPIASSVQQQLEELGGLVVKLSPTPQLPNSLPPPKTRSVYGSYQKYADGVLTVNTGSTAIDVKVDSEVFAVCTPRYWANPDGQKFDITRVWFDMSSLTLTNYKATSANEKQTIFQTEQPKLTKDTHIFVFAQEHPVDKSLLAKKIWIIECNK